MKGVQEMKEKSVDPKLVKLAVEAARLLSALGEVTLEEAGIVAQLFVESAMIVLGGMRNGKGGMCPVL